MDEICRLCLTVSLQMACKLGEELNILHKLSCLNVQVSLNNSLPSSVCYKCVKTLEDIENFREKVKRNEYKLKQHLNNKNLNNFYQRLKNYNISVENVKIERENADEDSYCNEPVYFEPVDEKIEVIIETTESIHEDEDVKQIILTENLTSENNISNTISTKTENRKSKRKNSNQFRGQKLIKTKRSIISNTKENSKVIQNLEANQINILANTSEPNTTKSEPANESTTELIEEENSVETKNGPIVVKIQDQQCLTCFKYLLSHAELIKHYKTVHYNKNNSNKSAKSKSKDKESNYKLKSDSDNGIMEDEAKNVKQKCERPYNCKICGRTFPSVYTIVRHGRSHAARQLYCSTGCGYSSVYKDALRDHEKRHQKDFKYKCATCGAGFQVKTWHDQHQNKHNNVKPFACDICGVAFHMHKYLTSHRSSVHVDISKGVSRYVCPHCDLAFHNKNNFRVHLELHTGKRGFLCDLCGKMCASAALLHFHKNSHVGVKPYTCSICNKKFAKKNNLTVHERAHAGERHLCQACGKHFAQQSTLRRHYRKSHPNTTEDGKNTENRKILNEF